MRFFHKEYVGPQEGDARIKEAFLLLPKRIGYETRWLERAVWSEKYLPLMSEDGNVWTPITWMTN